MKRYCTPDGLHQFIPLQNDQVLTSVSDFAGIQDMFPILQKLVTYGLELLNHCMTEIWSCKRTCSFF